MVNYINTIKNCTDCELSCSRRATVIGEGAAPADIMFIGEAPGKVENQTGRPFTGNSGRLFKKALKEVGITKNTYYITNLVKCMPPENTDASPEELRECRKYLDHQITTVINPTLIVSLGTVAFKAFKPLLELKNEHGRLFPFDNSTFFMGVYHPASVLYNKNTEDRFYSNLRTVRKAWKTLCVL